ncbi:MAG: Type 1 glutamine amidotransferase-like domain-containing protein [Candidatus Moranbacteria bacterium]|nr:Type 1 glutamine amidotransferase-like domain-containing protein [Candidatus Moranbacteria bacterium]
MKFLLTSSGITNASIEQALLELVGKPASETSVAFIPTAANLVADDKGWLIDGMDAFKSRSFKSIDIVDISAVPKDNWLPRFEAADVLCFGGGDEQYLAKVMVTSGLAEILPVLLETKVYIGISAGSMVVAQSLDQKLLNVIYPEEVFTGEVTPSLGLVSCHFVPHLNSPYFSRVKEDIIKRTVDQNLDYPLYALDDSSVLKIVDDQIEVVSEGEFLKLEK